MIGEQELESAEILQVLSSLVDKNLVVIDETPVGQRYRFVETMLMYLRDLSEDVADSRTRHRQYYVELAQSLEPKLLGLERENSLLILDQVYENLRLADETGATEDPESSLIIAGALWRYFDIRRYAVEWKRRTKRALERSKSGDTRERAHALQGLGALSWLLGDGESAKKVLWEGIRISEVNGDLNCIAGCKVVLGNLESTRDQFAESTQHFEESLAIYKELKNHERIAAISHNLGSIYMWLGSYRQALKHFEVALDGLRRFGSRSLASNPLASIGILHSRLGNLDEANALIAEARQIAEEFHDPLTVVACDCSLGQVAYFRGELVEARAFLERSIDGAEVISDPFNVAQGCVALSMVLLEMGDLEGARVFLQKSLSPAVIADSPPETARRLRVASAIFSDPRFLAVADRLNRESGVPEQEAERTRMDLHYARIRRAMGGEVYEAALREGERMSMNEAVAQILDS